MPLHQISPGLRPVEALRTGGSWAGRPAVDALQAALGPFAGADREPNGPHDESTDGRAGRDRERPPEPGLPTEAPVALREAGAMTVQMSAADFWRLRAMLAE